MHDPPAISCTNLQQIQLLHATEPTPICYASPLLAMISSLHGSFCCAVCFVRCYDGQAPCRHPKNQSDFIEQESGLRRGALQLYAVYSLVGDLVSALVLQVDLVASPARKDGMLVISGGVCTLPQLHVNGQVCRVCNLHVMVWLCMAHECRLCSAHITAAYDPALAPCTVHA